METMGDRIKAFRKARGMTMADVARHLGILKTNYRKYENGERHPKREQVERLAKLFGCSAMDILENRAERLATNLNEAMVRLVVSDFRAYESLLLCWDNYGKCAEIEMFFLDYCHEHSEDFGFPWENNRIDQVKELFRLSDMIDAMGATEGTEQRIKFMTIFIDYCLHRKDFDTVLKEVKEALGEHVDREARFQFACRVAIPAFSILRGMAVYCNEVNEPDMRKAFALAIIF